MLLRFSGQIVGQFYIPSFTVSEGEIAIICLPSGAFFHPLLTELVKLLEGEICTEKVKLISPFKYAKHIKESRLRYRFFPTRISAYHHRNANKANGIYKEIFKSDQVTPQSKLKTLPRNLLRKLSIYTTLSWTDNLIFDLAAVDPQGGEEIYEIVKTKVKLAGAAILLDHCEEFKNDCTVFIKAEYIDEEAKLYNWYFD